MRDHGLRVTRMVADALGQELGSVTAHEGASLESLLATREVVVFCGSGGVGKTSTAAAAALAAAARARRQGAGAHDRPGAAGSPTRSGSRASATSSAASPDELLRAAGLQPRGELYAAMLDTKRSWDELVLRHAPDEETAYRILDNRLYHNVTVRFVQSHDYIAMERLYDVHASGDYDLIVIDTPPTAQRDRLPRSARSAWPTSSAGGSFAGSRCPTASVAAAARA